MSKFVGTERTVDSRRNFVWPTKFTKVKIISCIGNYDLNNKVDPLARRTCPEGQHVDGVILKIVSSNHHWSFTTVTAFVL
jgi:hypothetical protein